MHSRLLKVLLPILLIGLLLCSCDVYAGERPNDYYNSKWICEDPRIEIIIDSVGLSTCVVGSGGDQQELTVVFSYGDEVLFAKIPQNAVASSKDVVFKGECSFGREKMTVRVYADEDQLFHGEYETLVFVRQ